MDRGRQCGFLREEAEDDRVDEFRGSVEIGDGEEERSKMGSELRSGVEGDRMDEARAREWLGDQAA